MPNRAFNVELRVLLSDRDGRRSTSLLRRLRLPFAPVPALEIHLGEHAGDEIMYACNQLLFDPASGGFSALEVHETDVYEPLRELYLHLGFVDESCPRRRPAGVRARPGPGRRR